jgi:hypothetical protein
MALSFRVRDDLVDLGRDEDGSVIVGRSFYVVAEDEAGHRWAHAHSFLDRVRRYDAEEGGYFWARGEEGAAEAKVARLLARIEAYVAAGGALNEAHWDEVDPGYGSAAYQELDAVGYFAARERHEARQAGEAVPFDQVYDYHFA